MTVSGKPLGLVFGAVVAAVCAAAPPVRTVAAAEPGPAMPGAGTVRVPIADLVDPVYADAVLKVVRQPTISARGASNDLVCRPAVYEWLLAHPDRVSLAWQRLKVPCVEITDLGGGKFTWADGEGSELVWQTVGKFTDGLVWYATGKVKANAVTPTVPVRAVVVFTHAKRPAANGVAVIRPVAQVFLQTDSKAANAVMRVIGPTAPKLAEQGAEQLIYFFNGIAGYVQRHPERTEKLLAPRPQK